MPAIQSFTQAITLFDLKYKFNEKDAVPEKYVMFKTTDNDVFLIVKSDDNQIYIIDIAKVQSTEYVKDVGQFVVYMKDDIRIVIKINEFSIENVNEHVRHLLYGELLYYCS